MPRNIQQPGRESGFTLLELLIVIAMMIFIATVSVVNYFGATRSTAYTAGQKNILSALQLARQRACLDATPTFFYMLNGTNYVIVRTGGSITDVKNDSNGARIFDPYIDGSTLTSAGRIVNLSRASTTDYQFIGASNVSSQVSWPSSYSQSGTAIYFDPSSFSAADWQVGDLYGFPLHEIQTTPKGFVLSTSSSGVTPPDHLGIKFMPDGTAAKCTFYLAEKLTGNTITFSVDLNGTIK